MEVLAPREQHSNQFVPSDTSTTPQGLTCPWFTPSVWALLEKKCTGLFESMESGRHTTCKIV